MPERPEMGTCPECGYRMVPVLTPPPCGHDVDPVRAPLDATGTVYAWTRVWSGDGASTLMAMVDFFDGGLRVTAPVMGADDIAVDNRVEAVVGEDTPVAFRPIET